MKYSYFIGDSVLGLIGASSSGVEFTESQLALCAISFLAIFALLDHLDHYWHRLWSITVIKSRYLRGMAALKLRYVLLKGRCVFRQGLRI